MNRARFFLLAAIVALVALFFLFDLDRYLSLEALKREQAAIESWYREHPVRALLVFFCAYVALAALSIPSAAAMTLAAGALFGLLWGTVVVSFASSIGATLAFLASRFVFRDAIQSRFGDRLRVFNEGMARDGAYYLFMLRLVPVIPFFVVNLVMGLTGIRASTYYWVSQAGMLGSTLLYVNAGTQLASLDSFEGLLSPVLLASFALVAFFPLIAKRVGEGVKARRATARWTRPARFERNLVVIGAGAAGLSAAYIAAALKAKVTLVEKHRMGGDCLNTGCVPSKALIRSTRLIAQARRAREFGLKPLAADFDFADIMERVQRVIRSVEPHDSAERYSRLGVECLQGAARITSPWTVEVARTDGSVRTLTTRAIVIAAGARPLIPPIPGIEQVGVLTSDTVWGLRELPRRLLVLGGGPIGCELAQCFARLGTRVAQVEMLPRLMIREDPEFSALVAERFRAEGIEVRTGHRAKRFAIEDGEKVLYTDCAGGEARIAFDALLCAVGRAPNASGYGLEELDIGLTKTGAVEVDEHMRTRVPTIYACGDVCGPYQFTHTAAHAAWTATVNALFGSVKKFRADFSVIPWATFTDPEIARVGLNETEAQEKGIPHEVTTYDLAELDRAIADEEARGLVKVLTVPGKDRVLGATIAGEHAGDLIAEYVAAMRHGIGLDRILGTIHVYPTFSEANRYAAGNWKRAHAPARLLEWARRFHAWRLG